MARKTTSNLPKFDAPPVIETMLGVEFRRLEKWSVPYFGVFWNQIKDRFPGFAVKPPLGSKVEVFDRPTTPPETNVQFLPGPPAVRCWFIDSEDRSLIQIQNNRFTYNWRKAGESDAYPHYDKSIRSSFERAWQEFAAFVADEALGEIQVVQCEVTYVNHIECGHGWDSAADFGRVFPCWTGKSLGEFLPAPENVSFDVSYRFPEDRGRLRVSVKPAIRHNDGAQVIQMNVTARGKPKGSDRDSILEWMDLGRDWVVRGFTDFTSEGMHSLWQKRGE